MITYSLCIGKLMYWYGLEHMVSFCSLFEESTSCQGWGKTVACYIHDQWVCLHFLLKKYQNHIPQSEDETLELSLPAVQRPRRTFQSALEALTVLPSEQVLPVFHCMKVLIPKVRDRKQFKGSNSQRYFFSPQNKTLLPALCFQLLVSSETLCIEAFDLGWKIISSLSNTQLIFWSNLKAFVQVVFDTEVLAVAASSKGQAYAKIREVSAFFFFFW